MTVIVQSETRVVVVKPPPPRVLVINPPQVRNVLVVPPRVVKVITPPARNVIVQEQRRVVVARPGNGRREVFTQEEAPGLSYPHMWWETYPGGGLKTLWVEDGT